MTWPAPHFSTLLRLVVLQTIVWPRSHITGEMLVHVRSRVVALVVVACTAVGAACGSGTTGSTGPASGALAVTVSAPPGFVGSVTVSGPGAYAKTISGTDTLRGLSAGSYLVTAAPQVTSDSLVSMEIAATVSTSPVAVSAGHTASTSVYYAARTGSGALWVGWGLANDLATALTSSQLAHAGSQAPTAALGAGDTAREITGAAFDLAGNLWVADFPNGVVKEFAAEQLAGGVVAPAVTLTFRFPNNPWGLAFDASNNLWVSFYGANTVVEFGVAQVDGFSGTVNNPVPQVSLAVPGPVGLAFDAQGALWVAGYNDSTIDEFPATALVSGGRATDSVTSIALTDVTGVTFDASGNLWAASESGRLVEYSAAQLAASTPHAAPNQTVTASSRAYRFDGVAFDNSGNLWASTESPDVLEYSPAQLAAGGTPTPARTATVPTEGITAGTYTVAFDPRGSGLPIAAQRVSHAILKR
jgi:sugar lactone lactonase YvrE